MLLDTYKDIGLAINTGKTKYVKVGRHRGMMAYEHITVDNSSQKRMKTFKYLSSLLKTKILLTRK